MVYTVDGRTNGSSALEMEQFNKTNPVGIIMMNIAVTETVLAY